MQADSQEQSGFFIETVRGCNAMRRCIYGFIVIDIYDVTILSHSCTTGVLRSRRDVETMPAAEEEQSIENEVCI